jgi:hypothetical protein
MHKNQAITLKFLHQEALTSEQPSEDTALKEYPDCNAFCCAQKTIFLANEGPSYSIKRHWNNIAGIRSSKCCVSFTLALMREDS